MDKQDFYLMLRIKLALWSCFKEIAGKKNNEELEQILMELDEELTNKLSVA